MISQMFNNSSEFIPHSHTSFHLLCTLYPLFSPLCLLFPPHSCRYVHVLVQKMAVNADLGFLLAVVAFLSAEHTSPHLEVGLREEGGRVG